MITDEMLRKQYYKALVNRDSDFDGIFFAAIKTTGVFCHATCRARKPKFENCFFYERAEEALLAGYRPCKICNPMSYPNQLPDEVKILVEAVEENPEKRWKEEDFRKLGIHSATVRRKFKDIYQMTFVQYARARRMGLAYLRGICDGEIKEVHENYMGATYTQHSTGVPDEKEGFAAFFEDFFKRNPKREINIVRAIEDGNFVFVHVHQKLNDGEAEWVTADIFRSDENGRIVEHWDVIDAYPKTIGQTDPIYADFELTDLDKTEDNKKIVRRFLVDVLQNGEIEKFDDYVAADLIQHNQEIAQGGAAYKDYLVENQVNYDFVFKVMGQGDYVVAYSKVWIAGQDYAHFDIYRLKDGKIAEHWDNKEVMPDKKDLANLGKF